MGGDPMKAEHPDAPILIVDDSEDLTKLCVRLLEMAGYRNVHATTDPRAALAMCATVIPDLVLLDLQMPFIDGFEVLTHIRASSPPVSRTPVIVLTGNDSMDTRTHALSIGATDFLGKPVDPVELVLRVGNHLKTRMLQVQLERHNELLRARVHQRTHELENARLEMLERLALAAEYRDDATHEHTTRVGLLSERIARVLGWPEEDVELIGRAAPLHDIGKIGVPDGILLKPGPLTPHERETMKRHTQIGGSILAGSRSRLLEMAEIIARAHHEQWDGSGYAGMRGAEIPMIARIVTVADVFDALQHKRPYKPAWPLDRSLAVIEGGRGKSFDPTVVDAFVSLVDAGQIPATAHSARIGA
jgi:putative two-component system response regulator